MLTCPFENLSNTLLIPLGNFKLPYLGNAAAAARPALLILTSACSVLHVQAVVWLPGFGIFSVHPGVDACDCTRGLCKHYQRVSTDN